MPPTPRRGPAALLACLPLIALAGCAGGEARPAAAPALAIDGLYPRFDPAKHSYASRCGRGAPPIRAEGGAIAVGNGPRRAGSVSIDPGVAPGADFSFTVFDGERRRAYTVRCLPADFPAWRFRGFRGIAPGYFVVSLAPSAESPPWVIVFDHEGAPRWWYSPPTQVLWAQVLRDGSIAWARSFGDGYGLDRRMAHEVRSLSGELRRLVRTRGPIVDGHELRELSDGSFLIASYSPEVRSLASVGGPARSAVVAAEIQRIDPRGRLRWRWRSHGRIALGETGRWWRNVLSNPRRRLGGLPTFDPVHINSIEPRGSRELVISTRHTDAVYGIRRPGGAVAWKLGGTETPRSLRVVGDPARRLFGGQHDARIGVDGTLSVYDNGKDRPRRPRVALYRLEPDRGRAVYLDQLNDPTIRSSHCCGSARQLPDGSWLVSWGDNPLVTAFRESGAIAFRLRLASSTFRAVPAPPGTLTAGLLDRGMEAIERAASGPPAGGGAQSSP